MGGTDYGEIRYGKLPLGVNRLDGLMKEMCGKAGLVGNFTNHSGKRTCATSLFNAGVDEQSIMDRTGHRSVAVREYKTKTDEIEHKVSDALNPPTPEVQQENVCPIQTKTEVVMSCAKPPTVVRENENNSGRNLFKDITNSKAVNFNDCNFNF